MPVPAAFTPPPVNTIASAAGQHTELADQLNAAMAASWGRRHLYLVTYGTPWVPLPTGGAPLASDTDAKTIPSAPRARR